MIACVRVKKPQTVFLSHIRICGGVPKCVPMKQTLDHDMPRVRVVMGSCV